ncbi:FecR family protein [Novosphingobium clariflavum]|uniref:FecR domain-containing protein n=1 Tax=Novosphingobium clariflavum TaxID=2029884 RepID=A0ABV6SA97_9SPHN|nr:FecR domain-containing protein [Novosphingobium clariflavum]
MDKPLNDTLELAADWADRFDDLTPDERRELAAWLEESASHARAFARMRRLMGDSALIEACEARDAAGLPPLPGWRMAADRSPGPRGRLRVAAPPVLTRPALTRRQALAAGIAGALALPLAGYGLMEAAAPDAPAPLRFASRVGERRRLTLPDGSGLLLDASSRVAVDFSQAARRVVLEQGAARFDVRHDPARPFAVHTPHAAMLALGTSFSVDRLTRASELRVFSGRVRLDVPQRERLEVAAHRWALIDDNGGQNEGGPRVTSGRFDPATRADWQDDWLDADAMPLGFAVERLARYSPVPMRIADPRLARLTFSGRFRLDQPEQSFELIGALFGLRPQRRGDTLYLA